MSSERARRLDVFVFSTLMNVGMSYLKLLVGRFTSLHVVYQIYCLSFGVLSLAMALQFSLGFKIFQQALMLLSCFGFAVGFFCLVSAIPCKSMEASNWAGLRNYDSCSCSNHCNNAFPFYCCIVAWVAASGL